MNIKLKLASMNKNRFQYESARDLNMRNEVFSGYISGRLKPSEDTIKKLESYFSVNRKDLGFSRKS